MANEKKSETVEKKTLDVLEKASLRKWMVRSFIFVVVLGVCAGGCYLVKKVDDVKKPSLVESLTAKSK